MVALQFLVLSAVVRVRLGQRFMLGVLIQAHPFFVNSNSKWTTRSIGKTFSLLSTNTVSRKSVLTDGASTPAGECFSDDQQYINVEGVSKFWFILFFVLFRFNGYFRGLDMLFHFV